MGCGSGEAIGAGGPRPASREEEIVGGSLDADGSQANLLDERSRKASREADELRNGAAERPHCPVQHRPGLQYLPALREVDPGSGGAQVLEAGADRLRGHER